MTFEKPTSYYEILEVAPDASPQEIRSAYLRVKNAYKKDSIALYSLINEEDTQTLLVQIEEAYSILSNPDRRREYDRRHGMIDESQGAEVVSIDRVPPMEPSADDDSLLIAPPTDFGTQPNASTGIFAHTEAPLPSSQSRSPAPERGAIEESPPAPEERPSPTPAHPGHSLLKPASLLPSSI